MKNKRGTKTKFLLLLLATVLVAVALSSCFEKPMVVSDAHTYLEFTSLEQLANHLDMNQDLRNYIAKHYPQHVRDISDENTVFVYALNPPFEAELAYISHASLHDYITYTYYLDGFRSKAFTRGVGTIMAQTMQDGGNDLYSNCLILRWFFASNEDASLKSFFQQDSSIFSEAGDNIYTHNTIESADGVPFGKMVYWVKDDYFFSASVPSKYVEEFIELLQSGDNYLSFEGFATQNAMPMPDSTRK